MCEVIGLKRFHNLDHPIKTRKGLIAHGLGQMNEKDRLNAIEPDLRAIVAQLRGKLISLASPAALTS